MASVILNQTTNHDHPGGLRAQAPGRHPLHPAPEAPAPAPTASRSECALLALMHLARHAGDGYVSVHRIAAARGIRARLLEQTLSTLKHARYVRSLKGQRGGYRLARAASRIRLAEIIQLFDGTAASVLTPVDSGQALALEMTGGLQQFFRRICGPVFVMPEQMTIADVA